jgi:N-acylglucosamine-6-phosphate 2-epimerase
MLSSLPSPVIQRLKGGLIVSCQAPDDSPLNNPRVIAAMAMAAERQGAVGVRVDGAANIRAVLRNLHIPVIGIEKIRFPGCHVYITPTKESVRRVWRAGADLIAIDCTDRPRPRNQRLADVMQTARRNLGVTIMADVATLEQGVAAAELGADLVATTLHGYTGERKASRGPAFKLLESLVKTVKVPVIMEGRISTVDQLRRAFDLGAYAVVVGGAITNIESAVRRFAQAAPRESRQLETSKTV